jgi:glutamate--cysteine ligase
MRGADCGDFGHIVGLPAFWVGLMYDQSSLDAAWDLVKGFTAETREGLRVAASEQALAAEAGGVKLMTLAHEVLKVSEAGLRARGLGEDRYLAPMRESLTAGTQADRLLALYQGAWGGDLTPVYETTSL